MRALWGTMRAELVGAGGVVERNVYLTKRYIWWDVAWFIWTVANTLTIVFIAKGMESSGVQLDVNEYMTYLLIGAVVWAYLGILFGFLMETVAWERWEGTIEYTFMAPLSRAMHLPARACSRSSTGSCAVVPVRRLQLFFGLSMPDAQFFAAFVVLARRVGLVHRHRDDDSVLPLISPEKGTQLGFVAQGTLLVVSGVYYPVEVLPSGCSGSRRSRRRRTRSRASARRSSTAPRCRRSGATNLAAARHRRRLDPARASGSSRGVRRTRSGTGS